jgi:DNA-binding PadR family transcriptional regulator
MHKLLRETDKDRVINVGSRASLYQLIERLDRDGLVEVVKTVRAPGYPERVEYAITDRGREVARDWLREMLSITGKEYPEFTAALSMIFALESDDARAQLELRAQRLSGELRAVQATLRGSNVPAGLPRLFLLEEEYRRAVLRAELAWIRRLIADLSEGRLSWNPEWLRAMTERFLPDDEREVPTAG